MRFAEFKILLEEKQKVYAIGDSHANAIAKAGKFVNLATDGRSAMSAENDNAISQVDPGSVVVLSAGANDMLSPNKAGVASRIVSLIDKLRQKKCKVYYILFAETDNPKFAKDRNALRSQVAAAIGDKAATIDMGSLQYKEGVSDGIHAPMGWYASAAQKVQSGAGNVTADEVVAPAQGAKPTDSKEENISALAVPHGRVGTEVADVQRALLALGYKLPNHGVDGVRGPETSAAVKEFQQAYSLDVDGDPGPNTIAALNKVMKQKNISIAKSTSADVKGTMSGAKDIEDADVKKFGDIPQDKMTKQARDAAEKYLGRSMNDNEWDYLLRATAAESAFNVQSYAMVMATMLNHTKQYAANAKNGVIVALMRPNAFQAVTGTSANGHQPSAGFTRGPSAQQLRAMCVGAVQYLEKVPHNQMNFSAMDPRAYGAGTNIGWRDQQLATKGSSVIAGSVFNTSMTA